MKQEQPALDILEESDYEGTHIKTMHVKVQGNIWRISQYLGNSNFVAVCKTTNNPFGGKVGKHFDTWADAIYHYKSPAMRAAIKRVWDACINTCLKRVE